MWVSTVLPAKSDIDVMFYLQRHQGLIIDRSLVYSSYPQDRINIQVIYRFAIAQMECKVNVLLNNCKENIMSLSLLVGKTVVSYNLLPWIVMIDCLFVLILYVPVNNFSVMSAWVFLDRTITKQQIKGLA